MKMTAVEWLVDQLHSDNYQLAFGQTYVSMELIEHAKAMEQRQLASTAALPDQSPTAEKSIETERRLTAAQQAALDEILDYFDFERVQLVMQCLQWQWHGKGVPNVPQLRQVARRVLTTALHEKCDVSTGGFVAGYCSEELDDRLTLTFKLSECSASIAPTDGHLE